MARVASSKEKITVFENRLLERLSRAHPVTPAVIWGPVALGALYLGHSLGLPIAVSAWLTAAGVLSWTLIEYTLHRFLFHWQPASPRLRKAMYPVHQLHHDVQEWDRLVAPPLLATPISLFCLGLFWLALGFPLAFPVYGGFLLGYLAYDYVHLYTHFGRPRTRVGKGLRRRHLQHHFACHDRWYGVSSPLWDYVFRTHVPRGVRPVQLR